AIELSRATLRNIRQNVAIALLTVTGLLAGVLLGEVHMAGGMFGHELSVLVVILNGMRLLRTKRTPQTPPAPARAAVAPRRQAADACLHLLRCPAETPHPLTPSPSGPSP